MLGPLALMSPQHYYSKRAKQRGHRRSQRAVELSFRSRVNFVRLADETVEGLHGQRTRSRRGIQLSSSVNKESI